MWSGVFITFLPHHLRYHQVNFLKFNRVVFITFSIICIYVCMFSNFDTFQVKFGFSKHGDIFHILISMLQAGTWNYHAVIHIGLGLMRHNPPSASGSQLVRHFYSTSLSIIDQRNLCTFQEVSPRPQQVCRTVENLWFFSPLKSPFHNLKYSKVLMRRFFKGLLYRLSYTGSQYFAIFLWY